MPQPSAVMSVAISAEESSLSKRARSTFRILPFSGRIAWNLRSRPCFAEPPAESPSTRYSSHSAGSRSWQSASLPGRPTPSSTPFLRVMSRALRAASRARAPLFQKLAQLLGDDLLDHWPHLGRNQLLLGLRGELRLGHLYR